MKKFCLDNAALREIRRRKEITQAALAAKTGIPESRISKMESGINSNPTIATTATLAWALQTTVDSLVKELS